MIDIVKGLYNCFITKNATLVEINPLGIKEDNHLVITDSKIIIDDNA